MKKAEIQEHGFIPYPRRFIAYRWFKPLLAGLLFGAFYMPMTLLAVVLGAAASGSRDSAMKLIEGLGQAYDGFDVYSAGGVIATIGSVAAMIPALFLASKIVKDRPFSSYGSSMGGFRLGVFLKSLLPALAAVIPMIVLMVIDGRTGENRFSAAGFILVTLIGPLQCIAEEYLFRGFLMQTLGGWFRIPWLAILLQVIPFALGHPYSIAGVLAVSILALALGFTTHYTKGIEAGSALHVVNNMLAFYGSGLGFGKIASETTWKDFSLTAAAAVIFIVLVVILDRKFHWYDRIKKDDVTPFNEKTVRRMEARTHK